MLDQIARSDLGKQLGSSFIIGKDYQPRVGVLPLRTHAGRLAELDTEVLFGETVTVLAQKGGYLRVRAALDGKEGFVPACGLAHTQFRPTHRVCVPHVVTKTTRSMQSPKRLDLGMNSLVRVKFTPDKFSQLSSGGWVNSACLKPINEFEDDFVEVAIRFLGRSYDWGGRTGLAVDCSGLIQAALVACGMTNVPRDSGPQSQELGVSASYGCGLVRGDLVFWKGHVGVMVDRWRLLHASDHEMRVVIEPLQAVISRRREEEPGDKSEITTVRRFPEYAKKLLREL